MTPGFCITTLLPSSRVRVQLLRVIAHVAVRAVVSLVWTQDMGGGTFDVSLLTIEDGIFEVKVPPLRVL